jgi:hypothetical protein
MNEDLRFWSRIWACIAVVLVTLILAILRGCELSEVSWRQCIEATKDPVQCGIARRVGGAS